MRGLPELIMTHAETLPEATPLSSTALLHLGNRPAVDQALSRLSRSGKLLRICQGVYMRPVRSCFGWCAPCIGMALESLSEYWGIAIVPTGQAAAHRLGLTSDIDAKPVYLTSGHSRKLHFDNTIVELRHAPHWQMAIANTPTGDIIRALAWLGAEAAGNGLDKIMPTLSRKDREELAASRAILPTWMAEAISARIGENLPA